MYYIGKIDLNKIGKYKYKVVTDEVVLTEERKMHILSNHMNNYEKYPKNSVMTAWIIRDSNLKKLRKKNKIIYNRE